MLDHFRDYTDVVGDNHVNLGAATLGLATFALTGEERYREWTLEYIDAWAERTRSNGGLIPSSVGPDGRAAWLADGVPLCTAPRNQFFPAIAPDGASGAIVAWQDSRAADSLRDVYAQRVSASGNIRWPLDGIAFGSTRGGRPSIAADGSGGAVVAWEDSLGPTESDVYAQRVDSLGQAGWTSGGVPIAVSAGLQTAALLVRTGAGATIAWEDHRGVPAGIYARDHDDHDGQRRDDERGREGESYPGGERAKSTDGSAGTRSHVTYAMEYDRVSACRMVAGILQKTTPKGGRPFCSPRGPRRFTPQRGLGWPREPDPGPRNNPPTWSR
jgi:hypothetical protein